MGVGHSSQLNVLLSAVDALSHRRLKLVQAGAEKLKAVFAGRRHAVVIANVPGFHMRTWFSLCTYKVYDVDLCTSCGFLVHALCGNLIMHVHFVIH